MLIQHNQLAGLRIDPGGHQFAGGGDDRVAGFRVDEVVQLGFAFLIVTSYAHDVLAALGNALWVEVDQCLAHALGVVDVVAEDDGLLVRIGCSEEGGDFFGNQLGARFHDQGAVHVLEVVDAVFDQLAVLVFHALGRSPALQVAVKVDSYDFVRRKKAVFDALLEGVAVHRLAKVGDAGNLFGFFGRCREADVGGTGEVFENLAPGRVFCCAAPVAFVNDHQIEEVW